MSILTIILLPLLFGILTYAMYRAADYTNRVALAPSALVFIIVFGICVLVKHNSIKEEKEAISKLACSRTGCTHIMCNTYIPSFGYICNECKGEFSRFLASKGIDSNNTTENTINKALSVFKYSPIMREDTATSVQSFFKTYTK